MDCTVTTSEILNAAAFYSRLIISPVHWFGYRDFLVGLFWWQYIIWHCAYMSVWTREGEIWRRRSRKGDERESDMLSLPCAGMFQGYVVCQIKKRGWVVDFINLLHSSDNHFISLSINTRSILVNMFGDPLVLGSPFGHACTSDQNHVNAILP